VKNISVRNSRSNCLTLYAVTVEFTTFTINAISIGGLLTTLDKVASFTSLQYSTDSGLNAANVKY